MKSTRPVAASIDTNNIFNQYLTVNTANSDNCFVLKASITCTIACDPRVYTWTDP